MYLSKKRNVESKGAREAGGGGVQLTAAPQPQICLKGRKEEIKLERREKKQKV